MRNPQIWILRYWRQSPISTSLIARSSTSSPLGLPLLAKVAKGYRRCPTWGYPTEYAYYRDASSTDAVLGIQVPFIAINAADDPVRRSVGQELIIVLTHLDCSQRRASLRRIPSKPEYHTHHDVPRRSSFMVRKWWYQMVSPARKSEQNPGKELPLTGSVADLQLPQSYGLQCRPGKLSGSAKETRSIFGRWLRPDAPQVGPRVSMDRFFGGLDNLYGQLHN